MSRDPQTYYLKSLCNGAYIGRPRSEWYATMSENLLHVKKRIMCEGNVMPIPEEPYTMRHQKGRHGRPDHKLCYYLWTHPKRRKEIKIEYKPEPEEPKELELF